MSSLESLRHRMREYDEKLKLLNAQKQETMELIDSLEREDYPYARQRSELRAQHVDWNDPRSIALSEKREELSRRTGKARALLTDICSDIQHWEDLESVARYQLQIAEKNANAH